MTASPAATGWRRRVLAGALLGLIAVAAFEYRFLSFVEFSNDDFLHLAIGQQIGRGALPVRDYVERGLPLMSLASAAGQALFGEGLKAELYVVSAAYAVTAALAVFVALRLAGSWLVALLLGAMLVLSHPVAYSYPKLLPYAAALVAAWAYASAPSVRRVWVLAAVVAAAFYLRHDHGVILGVAGVVLVAARQGLTRLAFADARTLTLAVVALLAPFLIWVQVYEGLGTYIADGIAFSEREAEKATWGTPPAMGFEPGAPLVEPMAEGPVVNVRWAPELGDAAVREGEARHDLSRRGEAGPNSWQYALSDWSVPAIERLVKDPAVADTHHINRSAFTLQDVEAPQGFDRIATRIRVPASGMRLQPNAVAGFYYLVWLLPVAALAIIALWRGCPEPARSLVVMAAVVQLASNVTMLRDPLDNRIREVLVPAVALLAFVAGLVGSGFSRTSGPAEAGHYAMARASHYARRLVVVVVLLVLVAGAGAMGGAWSRFGSLQLEEGWSGLRSRARAVRFRLSPPQHRTGDRLTPAYADLVNYLGGCTPPGGRLFVMTFAPEIFVYTDRGFAAGQAAMTPGYFATQRHSQLMLDRLAREDVPFVVFDSQTRAEMAVQYPRVMEYVSARYRDVARFPVGGAAEGKHLEVLAESGRAVLRTAGDGSRPCFV